MAFKLASGVISLVFLAVGAVAVSAVRYSPTTVRTSGTAATTFHAAPPASVQPEGAAGVATSSPVPRTHGGVVLLIASDSVPPSALPSWKGLDGRRVRVSRVGSMEDAAAVDPTTIAAIAIDESALGFVDWTWVQARFVESTSVAGLNIGMGRLLAYLHPASRNLSGQDGLGWVRGAEDESWTVSRRFYSVLSGLPCASGRTNVYDDPGTDTDVVTALVQKQCGSASASVGFE